MTTLIKAALGLGAAALLCCIPEWVAPLITPTGFLILMGIGLAALVGMVWRWYWEAVEREEGEKE